MRLLLFTSSKTRSGGSRQALYLAQGFAARGHEVLFFIPDGPDTSSLRGLAPDAPFWRSLGPRKNWAGALEEAIFSRTARRTGEHDDTPTVVHAFHNKAVKLLSWRGIGWRRRGVVCCAHRGVVFRPNNPLPYWSPGIDCFIANSGACAEVIRSLFVSEKRVRVVYNAVPEERVRPRRSAADMRHELGLPEDAFVFGAIGGDNPVKGVEVFLRAFQQANCANARLLVLGVARLEHWQSLALELGIADRISLVGITDAVGDYLQLFSAFVLPSLSESMPNTLLEALSAGLPAVCSDVGGVAEILGEGGLLAPPGDVPALAKALERMHGDAPARKAMREAAIVRARLFAPQRRLDDLEAIYRELASRSPYAPHSSRR